jgi:hypothetical protein
VRAGVQIILDIVQIVLALVGGVIGNQPRVLQMPQA